MTLGPRGGLEGPRVEIDVILAPIWGPFWHHFGALGLAFRGQENRVILKTLFDRIWVPLWAAQCAPSIVNNSKIEGSQFLVEGSFFASILTLFGVLFVVFGGPGNGLEFRCILGPPRSVEG